MKSLVMGIHSHVKAGDLAKVKKYLNEGKDPNKEDKVIHTTPFPAHLSSSLTVIQNGETLLSHACRWSHLEVVEFLLERGASLESQNKVSASGCCLSS
jgi:ankyrin repeat protein